METLGVGIEAGELAGMLILGTLLGIDMGIDMAGMFMSDGILILGTPLGIDIGIDIDVDVGGILTLSPRVPGSSVISTSC